ncbi:MAG: polysaccharide export protein [Thiobacillaceae bacterium]|nr:polysaccharide export protein [Thiobacillaceae bacterium]
MNTLMIGRFGRLLCAGLLSVALAQITGCAVIPGTHTYDMRQQSAVKLPVKQAEEVVPANVKLRPIDAQLIIEQERAAQTAATELRRMAEKSSQSTIPVPEYKIGPGDILSITVWEHPELTIPAGQFRRAEEAGHVVAEDGTIFFPYAGVLRVEGLTTREVRAILAQRLTKTIKNPQVDVRVISFRSKRVYVVGEVTKPGLQEINDVPTSILDAINRAGGLTKDADASQVLLTRDGKTWRVDLQALYEEGAVNQNVMLKPNDIVYVPDRALNKVFVLGEVQKPGAYFMNKRRMTLAEALAEAGYINQDKANPHWIFVMRGQGDVPELYHLDAKSPDALLLADRFTLRPRDILYVDAAEVARWNRVITNVLPTVNLLNTLSGVKYPLFGGTQP